MRVDHSTAGAKEACAHGVGYLALAIAGHHGGIPNFGSRADTKNDATLSGRLKRDLEPYDDWKTEVTLPPVKPFNMREFNTGFRLSFYIRMLFSCLVDADFIDTETFMDGALAPRGNYDALPALLDRLETYIAPWYPPKTELNRKRCAILDACKASGSTAAPGVYTLTVPTGGGKTTAAMAFALTAAVQNCMSRVIYAAPYTSIIDQNADTFEKIFGTENVIEHHSSAEYLFSESPNPAEYRKMLAAENWDAHYERLEITRPAYEKFDTLWPYTLARSAVRFSKDWKKADEELQKSFPRLSGDLLTSILNDTRYPATLLNGTVQRIRAEHDVTWARASVIKAYYSKNEDPLCPKEVLTVSVNKESTNIPYNLGRLFAVLERTQEAANPNINTTIKDRFFNSASATPSLVFPTLINLAQKHLAKLNEGQRIALDKSIGELSDKLGETFPKQLMLAEQGAFQLGYYQQRQEYFKKKTDTTEQKEEA